jgi:chromosome segregation ATPase
MAGRLHFRDSIGREGVVDIGSSDTVFVGRGLDCAIRTDDGMVSRRHSQIRMEGGRFVVENLSVNGTTVNNVRVEKQSLGSNDVIQCGSLTITFVEVAAQPVAGIPAKKSSTAVIDRDSIDEAPTNMSRKPYASPVGGGMPPAMSPDSNRGALPYGGPPSLPSNGNNSGGASMFDSPRGGAPNIERQSDRMAPGPAAGLPYGGPPEMPNARQAPRSTGAPEPGVFARGAPPSSLPKSEPREHAAERNVMVDLGLEHDQAKSEAEIKSLRGDLEKATANYEREVADSKRLRAEAVALRERLEETRLAVKDREEQAAAHDRVAEELRDELVQTRDDLAKLRNEMSQIGDTMMAKERAFGRSQEDVTKLRDDIDDLNRQLMEVVRNKDEGWRKLNDQLNEIEQLREVINAQERMLEERRIGLISQEEVIKELRGERERTVKTVAQLKAERDESATLASRAAAQISAIEEENKRLGRLMVEAQTDNSRGGGGVGSGEHTLRLNNELKDVRVEFKRLESDRDRLTEQYQREEQGRIRLESKLATLEVELQEATHTRLMAESARNIAQDALAKAEVARHRGAEEVLLMQRAKDQASTGSDDVKRESDRLRRRVAELEAKAAAPANDPSAEKLTIVEKQLRDVNVELDAARMDAMKARAEAARAKAASDVGAIDVVGRGGPEVERRSERDAEMAQKAQEVYEAINDILSEMRNNIVLVQSELGERAAPAIREAVDSLVDNAETAKGALRGLRDLAENK